MKRKIYHFTKGSDGNWKGTLRGGERASVSGPSKIDVLAKTVDLAKKAPLAQVIIQKETGVIQSERTYGKDPKRTLG